METEQGALEQMLRFMAEQIGKINAGRLTESRFKSYEEMVLALGKPYTAAKRPKGLRKKPNRRCFENALHLAMADGDLEYIEGFAALSEIGLPMVHAWCAKPDGTVVDVTWKNPETAEYFGIAFPTWDAAEAVAAIGYYGLIGNDFLNENTLIRTGELRIAKKPKGDK